MFLTPQKSFKLKYEETRTTTYFNIFTSKVKWYTLKNVVAFQYKNEIYEVPANLFYTDVASYPNFLQKTFPKFFNPVGKKISAPSVLHDFACEQKHLSYFDKHWIYFLALREYKVSKFKSWLSFLGVFCFYWLYSVFNRGEY